MNRPPPGTMVYWRPKNTSGSFRFGYCTYEHSYDLVRMGRWNGDTAGGFVVSINDIEWRKYEAVR